MAPTDPGRKPGVPPNSVAVLYFENLSPDTADAYLAEGLTEAIIVRLSKIERLSVGSLSAVRQFRGRTGAAPRDVGRVLGAAYLAGGNVRRVGDRLRVTVELLRSATGMQVWADRYERQATDLLVIEEEIAHAVATAVAGRLLPGDRVLLTTQPTRSPKAYEHFLRGNYYYAKRTQRTLMQAIAEYDSAAHLDSAFTGAVARAVMSRIQRGVLSDSQRAQLLVTAVGAVRQDSSSADAWVALGLARMTLHRRTYESAIEAMRRAIALAPAYAEARHLYASMLVDLGDDSTAAEAYRQALALDPARAVTLIQLAVLRDMQRRPHEARRLLDSAVVVDPDFVQAYGFRARVRVRLGDVAGARADADMARRLGATEGGAAQWLAALAWALIEIAQGDTSAARDRARRVADEGESFLRGSVVRRVNYFAGNVAPAMALAVVGDVEGSLGLLELFSRDPRLHQVLRLPEFDLLRTHPRFQRLVEESRPK